MTFALNLLHVIFNIPLYQQLARNKFIPNTKMANIAQRMKKLKAVSLDAQVMRLHTLILKSESESTAARSNTNVL